MSCQETQELMHGYLDGELDLLKSLKIERHLPECLACSQVFQSQQALRSAIKSESFYYQAPAGLRQRVQSAVQQTHQAEARSPRISWHLWQWLSAGAAVAVVVMLAWMLTAVLTRPSADDRVAQEIIAAHVRSLMAEHLTDVASSDQHTVKPWFNGRLDFSPSVKDWTERGFPLVGGRLDYINNRAVAALVYRRRQHLINLFIWPTATNAESKITQPVTHQGYQLLRWTARGMTYWVISDLNRDELQEFVQLVTTDG